MSHFNRLTQLGVAGIVFLLVMACGSSTPAAPTPDVNLIVASTMMAYTAEAAQTQLAAQPSVVPPPPATSPAPTDVSPPPTAAPAETAPDPLPAFNTGIILYPGDCFDLDTGSVYHNVTADCDYLMVAPFLLRPQNGALLSGYVSFEVPTLSHCQGAQLEAADLSPNSDLYMCARTNAGLYGFLVQRQDAPGAPPDRMIVDYWVFQ
ncbi:MAG: hypothetical protein GXP40_09170 [Chloroflexi bacterium]|nr:hypothetical protein [Chloroflexota bacterium]